MTNEPPPPPSADADRDGEPPAPPKRRRHRMLLAAAWLASVAALLVGLVALALYGALTTERGTRLAWHAAVVVSGGRLSGTLVGGTLAAGVRFVDLRWRTGGAGLSAAGEPGGRVLRLRRAPRRTSRLLRPVRRLPAARRQPPPPRLLAL